MLLIIVIRAGEPEPGVFGSLEPEPEPLEKKTRSRSRLEKKSGAGAAKKLAGSPALIVIFIDVNTGCM